MLLSMSNLMRGAAEFIFLHVTLLNKNMVRNYGQTRINKCTQQFIVLSKWKRESEREKEKERDYYIVHFIVCMPFCSGVQMLSVYYTLSTTWCTQSFHDKVQYMASKLLSANNPPMHCSLLQRYENWYCMAPTVISDDAKWRWLVSEIAIYCSLLLANVAY